MSEEIRPVLLGGTHIKKAIYDPEFYKILPQFLPIQVKLKAMHMETNKSSGCSSCRMRRAVTNVERDFSAIVSSLDSASGKIFKDYFGVPKMVIHAVNPTTQAVYLKEL